MTTLITSRLTSNTSLSAGPQAVAPFMARRTIAAHERCIVALDVASRADALRLVEKLPATVFYKIGLELFAAGAGRALLDTLHERGLKVFADLKLYDVPETVARATRQIAGAGAHFLTVHGDDAIMQAAVANKGEQLKILAVTALTSLDEHGLRQLGYGGTMADFVLEKAQRAQAAGCDGVVCAGTEVATLRKKLGDEFILVTPGVRRAGEAADDQKRIATPAAVITAGGDYLVVGRPVRNARAPAQAFSQIIEDIEAAVSEVADDQKHAVALVKVIVAKGGDNFVVNGPYVQRTPPSPPRASVSAFKDCWDIKAAANRR